MELDYSPALDGAPQETFAHPSPALAMAQRLKRENADAIVTIVVDALSDGVAAVCPECFGAVGETHSASCRWRGTAVLTHQAVYRPADQARS